jgi:sensor domain CHASE-containing protein
MGASNSSSVVVSKPTAPAVSGFHVKISFDGQDIVNNEGEISFSCPDLEEKCSPNIEYYGIV